MSHATPRAVVDAVAELIHMGFPSLTSMTTVSLCVCHNRLGFGGYYCPRCHMKSCALPMHCKSCELALVGAVDIARCQSMETTPPPFLPLPAGDGFCFLCCRRFLSGGGQCPACHGFVCLECDVLVHSTLQFCPNCHKNEVFLRQEFPIDEPPPVVFPSNTVPEVDFLNKVIEAEACNSIVVLP